MTHSHPSPDSPDWDNPDFCPFCGEALPDGGAGFMDHVSEAPSCRERFDAWREAISGDMDGEWIG